jgi:uncharacterized protein
MRAKSAACGFPSALILIAIFAMTMTASCSRTPATKADYAARPVLFTSVEIDDGFWSPRLETNRTVTIPFLFDRYEKENHSDSRLVEAGANLLALKPDPAFQKRVAAMLDRALDSYRRKVPNNRWKDLLNGELYAAGHFFEAAVAFHRATGERTYLDAARGIGDDIAAVFGPDKRRDVSQHEEVKIGLIRLARATGDSKYLDLARFFLDERGRSTNGRALHGEYAQDHKPVVEQERAIGHAVRAMYLYNALADLAAYTGEPSYRQASLRIWDDAVSKRTYLTGGIGTYRDFEDFGDDYDLPNLSCWNEICAAVGNVLWNHRLFLLEREGKYVDMLERILYNGFLAGVSLSGDRFLYQTPLQATAGFSRQPWFGPNCCPPNLARTLAHLGDFIYATGPAGEIYVNLFIGNRARIETEKGLVSLAQKTSYPWDGRIRIAVDPERSGDFPLHIRIPGWARNESWPGGLYRAMEANTEEPRLKINGQAAESIVEKGYAVLRRTWSKGDVVEVDFPMPVQRLRADDSVADDRGRVALERGPLVFCAEGPDNGGHVFDLLVTDGAELGYAFDPALLGGIGTIRGAVSALGRAKDRITIDRRTHTLVAIPFYAFANRASSDMAVWLAAEEGRALPPPAATIASRATWTSSSGNGSFAECYPGHTVPTVAKRFFPTAQDGSGRIEAVFDQAEPVNSLDGSSTYLRLRPQDGDQSWIECAFAGPERISSVEVYWKDNKEYCLLPKSWRLLYRDGETWKPVPNAGSFGVGKDQFNRVTFGPVSTAGLRFEIELAGKSFKKGDLGPPDANYLAGDLVCYEGGIIEIRISK